MKIEFNEQQKFTQWWIWIILLGIGILPIIGVYKQLILNEQFGDKPLSDLGIVIFSVFVFCLIALFWFMRLTTKIDHNYINMNFFPFVRKRIAWNEIKSAQIINYGFVGGWGIRLWTEYGTIYNIRGNKGLAIELKNGEKFLIGTQKELELKSFIETASAQPTFQAIADFR